MKAACPVKVSKPSQRGSACSQKAARTVKESTPSQNGVKRPMVSKGVHKATHLPVGLEPPAQLQCLARCPPGTAVGQQVVQVPPEQYKGRTVSSTGRVAVQVREQRQYVLVLSQERHLSNMLAGKNAPPPRAARHNKQLPACLPPGPCLLSPPNSRHAPPLPPSLQNRTP